MISALPLDEIQIARAAEEMIAEYGDEALSNADDQINALKAKGFNSIAKTWELIREIIKDVQMSDDNIRGYPPINSHPCRGERINWEDDDIEPLGEVEQALLDGWLKIEGPTDAAVHDSQVVDDILDLDNTASDVWADSAYRSTEIEAKLKEKGLKSRIHRKGHRNKPLTEREKRGNKTRAQVRARVEHVFGAQGNDMGGTLVRSIGLVRVRARIGLKNLAYNMRRLVQLECLAAAAPT